MLRQCGIYLLPHCDYKLLIKNNFAIHIFGLCPKIRNA